MGQAAGRLSAEAMLALLAQRDQPEAMVGNDRRRQRGGRSHERHVGRAVRRRTRSSPSAARPIGSRTRSRRSCPNGSPAAAARARARPRSRRRELGAGSAVLGAVGAASKAMLTSYSDAELRVDRIRPRAVERQDARGRRRRRRATIRRSGSTAWLTTVSDARAARARSPAAARPPASSRRTRCAGATSPRPSSRTPTIWCASATSTRRWQLAEAVVDQAARSAERAAARRAPALEQLGRGVDDEARRRAPAQRRRRRLRAVQAAVPRDRDRGDHAAGRGAVERTGRAVAPAAARHPASGSARRAASRCSS